MLTATSFIWFTSAHAATAGPNFPTTGANDTTVGTIPWTNPGFVTANDTNLATSALTGTGVISNYLFATNFAFAIPTGATINGVSVSVSRNDANTNTHAGIEDSSIKLVDGSVVGTEHAATTIAWPTTEGVASYGSPTDLWGTTLTDTIVNSTLFGVAISAMDFKVSANGGSETADINYVTMTITYTAVGGGVYSVPSSAGQYLADGTTLIPLGSGSSQEQQIFQATMTSPLVSDTVTLQFEGQLVGTAFTNTPTLSSAAISCSGGTCSSGVIGTITATALPPGSYHWQIRTSGSTGASLWQSYPIVGTNVESATDFAVLPPSGLMRGGKTFIDESQTNACATGSCL